MEKTIAAISTAIGQSGISVIRVSGENAIETGDKVFKSVSGKKLADLKGYTCLFGVVYKDDEKIDECIASVFKAPHSYTGEDIVELSCHGGYIVSKTVLRLLFENGVCPAEPGEFTKRAFLNNKIDLIQAEAVMDIISSKSDFSRKAAMNIKEGHLSEKINHCRDLLINLVAHLDAWADFPEEDIEEIENDNLFDSLNNVREYLSKLLNNYDRGQLIKNGLNTVIIGKPNVGKSTIMNFLSGTDKSIVTDIPGTTRDVVEETVTAGSTILNLFDTAGIRDSDDIVEKMGVDKALDKLESAHLIIAVFDNSSEISEEDINILKKIKNIPSIIVINKNDLESRIDENIFKEFKNLVYMSAKNEDGTDLLIDKIESIVRTKDFDDDSALIYNERQRILVSKALESVDESVTALKECVTYDAITVSIEEAIGYLLELTGEKVTETVVDKVFHNFCVGK